MLPINKYLFAKLYQIIINLLIYIMIFPIFSEIGEVYLVSAFSGLQVFNIDYTIYIYIYTLHTIYSILYTLYTYNYI